MWTHLKRLMSGSGTGSPAGEIQNLPRIGFNPEELSAESLLSLQQPATATPGSAHSRTRHTRVLIQRALLLDQTYDSDVFQNTDAAILRALTRNDRATLRRLVLDETSPDAWILISRDWFPPIRDPASILPRGANCLFQTPSNSSFFSPIQLALITADGELLGQLLDRGDDPVTSHPYSPHSLTHAVLSRDTDLFKRILELTAKPDFRGAAGIEALFRAIEIRWRPAIESLLAKGVDPGGGPAAEILIRAAIRSGEPHILRTLLGAGGRLILEDPRDPKSEDHAGPKQYLLDAAYSGSVAMLHELIAQGVSVADADPRSVIQTCLDPVLTIQSGFFAEYMRLSGEADRQAQLLYAIARDDLQFLKAQALAKDALHACLQHYDGAALAAAAGAYDCLQYLHESGYRPSSNRRSAYAAAGWQLALTDRLEELENLAKLPEAGDLFTDTLAAYLESPSPSVDGVQYLIQNGADLFAGDWLGSPLNAAITLNRTPIARTLYAAGARLSHWERQRSGALLERLWLASSSELTGLILTAGKIPANMTLDANYFASGGQYAFLEWLGSVLGPAQTNDDPDFADALLLQSVYLKRPDESRHALELGAEPDRPWSEHPHEESARSLAERLRYPIDLG